MTRQQLNTEIKNQKLSRLHTSWHQGYVSRKSDGVAIPYTGKFGTGYALLTPSFNSTRYCYITYFVK